MLKKPLFGEMFFLLVAVWLLNYVANVFHLYWSIYEFDSVVHFLGGAVMSSFFLWLYFFSGFFGFPKKSFMKFLLISILGAMFVAVSWEIFEFAIGEAVTEKADYPYDTMIDLIMDLLGALAICLYGYMKNYES